MALGDLVTGFYMFEYKNIVIGATTDYDLNEVTGLLGFLARSSTIDRFGRNGASSGRHYANMKSPVLTGRVRVVSDTDFQTKRQALASNFALITNPDDAVELVTVLPGPGLLKVQTLVRPVGFEMPLNRQHALKYAPYMIKLEMPDALLYSLTSTTTVFTVPSDTEVLTNNGNAPASWIGTLVGPATSPIITHIGTSQTLSFSELTLTGSDTLVYDSSKSTVEVNGAGISHTLASGSSWFDLDPGAQSISFSATDAATASFSITTRDAYWSV